VGLLAKFHFPISPYFLLYKHPDTNIRSTAWLTVMTSIFALFMQIVYEKTDAPKGAAVSATKEIASVAPTSPATLVPPKSVATAPIKLTVIEGREETRAAFDQQTPTLISQPLDR
jgi:hypothetical protein